jgi:Kdo2-lipid IVA lauroyltransferase/acyltransferase
LVKDFVGKLIVILLKISGYLFGFQPRRMQLWLGSILGSLLRILQFRASIVRQNIELAFPGQEGIQRSIFKESYKNFGNLILEILLLFGPMRKFVSKYVDVVGIEHWKEARQKGKGVIFLASHMGNWEVMAAAGAVLSKVDLLLVTKLLKPLWLHQAIEEGRRRCNVAGTYEPRTLRDVLSHLKKNGTVGFVLDQYSGPPVGVRVPVFNIPVGTSPVVATLVKRTGAPILPVNNYRKANGRWEIVIGAPIEWKSHENPHFELALNTAQYASIIEKAILAHPAQWLWTHRRFKGDLSPLREGEWSEARVRR